jgi:hypothetical protein
LIAVISRKCFTFRMNDRKRPETGTEVGVVILQSQHLHTIRASSNVQQLPPWVKDTELYQLAVKEGSLIEVSRATKKALERVAAAGAGPDANLGLGNADFAEKVDPPAPPNAGVPAVDEKKRKKNGKG